MASNNINDLVNAYDTAKAPAAIAVVPLSEQQVNKMEHCEEKCLKKALCEDPCKKVGPCDGYNRGFGSGILRFIMWWVILAAIIFLIMWLVKPNMVKNAAGIVDYGKIFLWSIVTALLIVGVISLIMWIAKW